MLLTVPPDKTRRRMSAVHEADAGKALTHEHVELLDVGHGVDVQMSRECGKGRADRSSAECRCTVLYNREGGRSGPVGPSGASGPLPPPCH
jgi:hypothetical protein